MLVDAANDINKVLDLDPCIDVKLGVKDLRVNIGEAAGLLKEDDPVSAETRAVLAALDGGDDSGDETEEKVAVAARDKAPKGDKVNKFVPIGRESNMGKIVGALLAEPMTAAEVGAKVQVTADAVLATLKKARSNAGIDFAVEDETAVISIVLPEGVDSEAVWKAAAAEKPAKALRAAKEPREKPAKKAASNGSGTKTWYGDADVIKLVAKENPKKPGSASHDRFALYEDGMTCGKFIAAGGSRADLSWDRSHEFIKIVPAAV